ncbi:hypothetical protein ROV96_09965 [Stenotrophomonas pavanii]|uniref:hypothetical protein n=1 Tax=Stenotrophomonas pavanii TaxID=487698 RepID=UPI002895DDA9|nr:hypothetical protein [Stenotrophomonas pavanii]MDT3454363.1 hypothetical protein [Stenotrophomonas pavanii]MDT3464279.1 hypothetical protein [Stenotrophomonas pavanii]
MNAWVLRTVLLCFPLQAIAGSGTEKPDPSRVIILGVDHAAQLVSSNDSPAMLAAFLDRAQPDAICIERSPEAFARNDYYEFTYEVQDVIVPFARARGVDLCPIDWAPPSEDAKLGFGTDLEAIPQVRPDQGFQGFLSFPRPAQLNRDIFHADTEVNLAKVTQWAVTPSKRAKDDLPRRLYLYRTYLQAKRVAAAAKARPGGTIVVVVGEFHKRDMEAVLSDDNSILLVQPTAIGRPSDAQRAAANRDAYRYAIASFNLLGVQAGTGNINYAFVDEAVAALAQSTPSAEVDLYRTRLDLLRKRITSEQAVERYRTIAIAAGDARFSWTGVSDNQRVDSYFDPFGNLSVRQRALLEAARELGGSTRMVEAEAIGGTIANELDPAKSRQFQAYFERYIRSGR